MVHYEVWKDEWNSFGMCFECNAVTCWQCDMFLAEHDEFDVMEKELDDMVTVKRDKTMCPTLLKNQTLIREHQCIKKHRNNCREENLGFGCGCGFSIDEERICDRCMIEEKPVFK